MNEDTPDMMRELLVNAGYVFGDTESEYNSDWWYRLVQSPDGWEYKETYRTLDQVGDLSAQHMVIQKAYAHYQQVQELERLRSENKSLKVMVSALQDDVDKLEFSLENLGY